MRKRILSMVATLALVLVTAISFSACGSAAKMKLTLQEFNDEFVFQVVAAGIPSDIFKQDATADANIDRQHGVLYSNKTIGVAEFNQGRLDVCIEVVLSKPSQVSGMTQDELMSATLSIGDLKVEANGKTYEFVASNSIEGQIMAQFYGYTPSNDNWYVLIESISADTEIKFTGHAAVIASNNL